MCTKIIGELGPRAETIDSQENPVSNPMIAWRLCLYKVAMPMDNALSLDICYSRTKESESMEVGVYTAFHTSMVPNVHYRYHALPYSMTKMVSVHISIPSANTDSTLVEVGLYCRGNIEESASLEIIHAFRLAIMPVAVLDAYTTKSCATEFTIDGIQLVERGAAPNEQKRLTWEWHGKDIRWPNSIPWSKITGPFSHFTIYADGRQLGHAYCLEFPLTDEELNEMIQDNGSNKISFEVKGWSFGGLGFSTASESCPYEERISCRR